MKIRRMLSVLFMALAFQSVAFASSGAALDVVYDQVLPPRDNPRARTEWTRLSKQELDAALKTAVPLRAFAFYAGFKFKGGHDLFLFRFIKPVLLKDSGFCRSDVALYQVHGYKPGLTFDKQNVTTVGHFGELVSFREKDVQNDCKVSSLEGLNHYTFVDSFLTDQTVAELWQVYTGIVSRGKITRSCKLQKNARLSEISIGVAVSIYSNHYYHFSIKNGADLTSIAFTLAGGHLTIRKCYQNLIF